VSPVSETMTLNYAHFVTYNDITHNLFPSGGLCSLQQDDQVTVFIINIFVSVFIINISVSVGSGHNSNDP
jgi:hypothetical protein